MKRFLIIAAIVVVVLGAGFSSWVSISVDSAGQFSRLADGTLRYTHTLRNYTWHPLRYVVAADPGSLVGVVLVKATSSVPDKTVTRMQPTDSGVPWSVTVTVPGRQQASIVVDFKPAETLANPVPCATTDMGGIYPTVTLLMRIDR